MCFSDFPVPLVPLWSRTLRTLQRYSGEWAPLPSELSGTCLYRFRKALACPDAEGLLGKLPAGVYRGEGVRGRGGGPLSQTNCHRARAIWEHLGVPGCFKGAQWRSGGRPRVSKVEPRTQDGAQRVPGSHFGVALEGPNPLNVQKVMCV